MEKHLENKTDELKVQLARTDKLTSTCNFISAVLEAACSFHQR